jgi:hypothetical protein
MGNSQKYRPTIILIAVNVAFYIYTSVAGGNFLETDISMIATYGQVNAFVFHGAYYQLLTSMFVHANIAHIGGNMLFLLIFGLRSEEMFSLPEYLSIYFLGGLSGVHQFVRIGAHAMTGFQTRLSQDLPPYVTAADNPAVAHGINSEGLKRRGFSSESIMAIKAAYKTLYKSGLSLEDAKAAIQSQAAEHPEVQPLADFLSAATRGILR